MRTSHCQNMTDICNAWVFAKNPFHLLGLSPFANARAIRRRREDLESAQALGASSWKDEFKQLLGHTPIPDSETVDESFRRLEDPQKRIVDEFFWFWPLEGADDEALDALRQGKRTVAEKIWKREEKSGDIRRSMAAKHNVAIYNHFYAIDSEWEFIEADVPKDAAPDDYANMCKYWEEALVRWEDLADDEDLWDLVKDRVKGIGDNRLTSGYVRRMRDEFPIAFDRINGDIAVAYAKLRGHEEDTKRHLLYMEQSHQGLDDVQATLDAIFDPIERELDLLSKEVDRVNNTSPYSALSAARSFLEKTEGIRKIADDMLGKAHPLRIKIYDKVASECNFSQVAYGNKTKQWEECLKFEEEILPLACSTELKEVMTNNLKVLKQNFEAYKREHYCWFCQKNPADPALAVEIKMYGDVQIQTRPFSSQYRATWRNITVKVPRCRHCEDEKKARESEDSVAWRAYSVAKDCRSGWNKFWDVETDEVKAAKLAYDKIREKNYKIEKLEEARRDEFPLYVELKCIGFKIGEKPSDWECQKLYDAKQNSFVFGGGYGRNRYGY